MKINDRISTGINPQVDQTDASANKQSVVTQIQAQDNVTAKAVATTATISTEVQTIQSLASSGPVFDNKKVEALRNEIDAGTFSVNTDKVADGLIKSTISLVKSSKNS
jgi:negative regulator of flagellin synthesis FlgM